MADFKERRFCLLPCWLVLLIVGFVGCSGPFDHQMELGDLNNPNPAVRIMAIKWAGENKVEAAVPLLVDSLQDEDPSVRFYAVEGLRRITGTDNGYDYKGPAHERAASVENWRQWLSTRETTE